MSVVSEGLLGGSTIFSAITGGVPVCFGLTGANRRNGFSSTGLGEVSVVGERTLGGNCGAQFPLETARSLATGLSIG